MARPYAMAAQFRTAGSLVDAVRKVREAGYSRIDSHSPFPIDEMPDALGFHETRLPWIVGIAGAAALAFGLWVMWFVDVAYYPINVGGRPTAAWPAYGLPVFEFTVLVSAFAAVIGMLVLNRLPRLNHPLFELDRFERASADRFFLVVLSDDPRYDSRTVKALLEDLGAEAVEEVPG